MDVEEVLLIIWCRTEIIRAGNRFRRGTGTKQIKEEDPK
jgi:hypothetical protein